MAKAVISARLPALRPALLVLGILLIAMNMRAPFVAVAPVLERLEAAFALDKGAAGSLTALPLLIFAIGSPFCATLARRLGLERSLFGALGLVVLGIVVRSAGPLWALFVGTGCIGAGIAAINVLLPSLVKRDFPGRIAAVTSAYAVTSGVAAGAASASIVPLAALPGWGWQGALLALLPVPLLALALWAPQLAAHTAPAADTAALPEGARLRAAPLAWQVTAFFGLNSAVYYAAIAWLPALLGEAGYSREAAGGLHGLSQLATAVPGLFLAPLVRRMADQRAAAVGSALLTAAALLGLMLAPAAAPVWAALFGFGTGATFILALAFLGLRTRSPQQAAALSGMAQCVGYTVAAAAPPAMGWAHDRLESWTVPMLVCLALCLVMAAAGYGAGRARQIG